MDISGVATGSATVVAPDLKRARALEVTVLTGADVRLFTQPGQLLWPGGVDALAAPGERVTALGVAVGTPKTLLVFEPVTDGGVHPTGIASTLYLGVPKIGDTFPGAAALGQAAASATLSVITGLAGVAPAGASVPVANLGYPIALAGVAPAGSSGQAQIGTLIEAASAGSSETAGDLFVAMVQAQPVVAGSTVQAVMEVPSLSPSPVAADAQVTGHLGWTGGVSGNAAGVAYPAGSVSYDKPLPSGETIRGGSYVLAPDVDVRAMRAAVLGDAELQSNLYFASGVTPLEGDSVGASVAGGDADRSRGLAVDASTGGGTTWGHIYKDPDDIFPDPSSGSAGIVAGLGAARVAEGSAAGSGSVTSQISSDRRIGTGVAAGAALVASDAMDYAPGSGVTGRVVAGGSGATGNLARHRPLTGQAVGGSSAVPGRDLSWMAFRGKPQGVATLNSPFLQEIMRGSSYGQAALRTAYESGTFSAWGEVDLTSLLPGGMWPAGIFTDAITSDADLAVNTYSTLKALTWVAASRPTERQMATWVEAGPLAGAIRRYGSHDATGRYISITRAQQPIRRQETYRV